MGKAAAAIVVTLLAGGHWFGGREGTVEFRWEKEAGPDAVVSWRLGHGETVLARGEVRIPGGGKPGVVKLSLPEVRVRTKARLVFKVTSPDGKDTLVEGEREVWLYPEGLLSACSGVLKGKETVVWGPRDGLAGELAKAGVPHTQMDGPGGLQMLAADLIVVDRDRIDASPFSQAELTEQARGGAAVLVLAQPRAAELLGCRLVAKARPKSLVWEAGAAPAAELAPGGLDDLLGPEGGELGVIELPGTGDFVRLAGWPGAGGGVGGPALVAAGRSGRGRVLLCQLPLGDWRRDPRGHLVLCRLIEQCLADKWAPAGAGRPLASAVEEVGR